MDQNRRAVWRGLVAYANSEDKIDLIRLRETLSLILPWPSRQAAFGFADTRLGHEGFLLEEATKYLPDVKALLMALCKKGSLPWDQLDFLREHAGQHINHTFEEMPYAPNDPEHNMESMEVWTDSGEQKLTLLRWYVRVKDFKDIADPICDFILEEHTKLQESGEPFPIILCEYCSKLAMPERIGRMEFCSDGCRAANYESDTPQEVRNDYQWLYRFERLKPGQRRKYLAKAERRERYNRLRAHPPSERCRAIIQRVGAV